MQSQLGGSCVQLQPVPSEGRAPGPGRPLLAPRGSSLALVARPPRGACFVLGRTDAGQSEAAAAGAQSPRLLGQVAQCRSLRPCPVPRRQRHRVQTRTADGLRSPVTQAVWDVQFAAHDTGPKKLRRAGPCSAPCVLKCGLDGARVPPRVT